MKRNKIKLIPKVDLAEVKYEKYPWPYKDNSVEEIVCTNIFHKIPSKLRGQFMEEAHRILKPKGKLSVHVPYWSHMRAIADFDAEWPPVCELSFCYFDKSQREAAKVHPELKCDFAFELSTYGYTMESDTASRSAEVQADRNKHYTNSVTDLQIHLVKR